MPIIVVVGGQFGGEGKGKITAHMCRNYSIDAVVRCGGANSGHTVTINGKQTVLRQIPAGVVKPRTKLFLAAGCLIDLNVFLDEVELFNLSPDRLKVDYNAVVMEKEYARQEEMADLNNRIGSTCTGTGIAVAKRVLRTKDVKLAKDVTQLRPYLADVSERIITTHLNGEKIVIEGTQGFGLSVYHSPYYPYATSRDTTAAGFLSEVGVSPLAVTDIIMVVRTFPIRVGGNSGPLINEIDWGTIQRESGYPYQITEFTTVTKKLRRVGRFDIELVKRANSVNMPTHLALMGVDYLDYNNNKVRHYDELTPKTKEYVLWLESELGTRVNLIGTGPTDYEVIDRIKTSGGHNHGEIKFERIEQPIPR